ncbi:hypothetical protein OH492_08045 [Vibrio chagasii]|nr:hypothetical protein [Vibrio chagasii]
MFFLAIFEKVDERLNFITNAFLVFPQLPLLIVLAAFLGQVGSLVITVLLGMSSGSCVSDSKSTDHGNWGSKEFIISAEVM